MGNDFKTTIGRIVKHPLNRFVFIESSNCNDSFEETKFISLYQESAPLCPLLYGMVYQICIRLISECAAPRQTSCTLKIKNISTSQTSDFLISAIKFTAVICME
jgi:hypothetical protein